MQLALGNMLDEAIRRVIGGEPLASFCDWFVAQLVPAMEMALLRAPTILRRRVAWS